MPSASPAASAPAGIHGLLIAGCDVADCCPGPLLSWAAGVFRDEPETGAIAQPLALDVTEPNGAFELPARRPPVFLCAGEPQDGGLLRVDACIELDATRRARRDFVLAPDGVWTDCSGPP